jgi:hypothetical protein
VSEIRLWRKGDGDGDGDGDVDALRFCSVLFLSGLMLAYSRTQSSHPCRCQKIDDAPFNIRLGA